ncbi:MAG: class I SAM-dependent methyltransferase [Candidatus Aenigmatarchaeota archaeon]
MVKMEYGYDYYEGNGSNYSFLGGYSSLRMGFCRFFIYRKALSIIKKYKSCGRLLDVGCAYGFWAGFLNKNGFDVVGCDVSSFAIKRAKNLFPDIDFLEMDIEKPTSFADREFDAITAFDVIEHCKNLGFVLQEIKRILKDDGVLLVIIPDKDLFPKEKDSDKTHIWHMDFSGWRDVFCRNGLKIIDSWIYPNYLRIVNSMWCVRFVLLEKGFSISNP